MPLVARWGSSFLRTTTSLTKDHYVLNDSPIFIVESSTFDIFAFQIHCIQYIPIWKIVLDLVKGTWPHNFMAGCGSLVWANTWSFWSGIKSWPGAGCLQRMVTRRWQQPTTSLPYVHYRRNAYLFRPWCLTGGFTMMMSSNGNSFNVTGPLCGEFTGERWIFTLICARINVW